MNSQTVKPPHLKLSVKDLDCIDCARALEREAKRIEGVEEAKVSAALSTIEITLKQEAKAKTIIAHLRKKGYDVIPLEIGVSTAPDKHRKPISGRRIVLTSISGALILVGYSLMLLHLAPSISRIMFIAATFVALPLTLVKAAYALRNRTLDMNVLLSVAVVAAGILGEWEEASAVVFLFSIANILEAISIEKSRRAIESLLELAPEKATVKRNGLLTSVDANDVKPGEIVVVKPGERIPLEGIVSSGRTSVDESAITGEPMPVEKDVGSEVYAGTLNEEGLIEIKVTKPKEESTISKIIHLVEHVEEGKAPLERFVDKFARIYTPAVVASAAGVAIVGYILGYDPHESIYRALVLLIIACPCALVISTPVAIVSGITSAARKGILIKGGAHLEGASRIRALAVDKTGTLTRGRPSVSHVKPFKPWAVEDVIRIAASVESASTHPLAGAILAESRRRSIHFPQPDSATEIKGRGVSATLGGKTYYVGKPEFFVETFRTDPSYFENLTGATVVAVGTDAEIIGIIEFEDQVREGIKQALREIKKLGIEKTIIITGDTDKAASRVAKEVDASEYHSNLLPQDKVDLIRTLKTRFGQIAMVGDGVNDAPALAAADLGIAMGAIGSDAAIETADVALMSDDFTKIVPLFRLAHRVRRITRENITLAIVTKGIFLGLAVSGLATMWMAVFADMGTSLLVIANALRVLADRKGEIPKQQAD